MKRRHVGVASVLLAVAAIAGVLALTKATPLGLAADPPSSAELASRAAALDRAEAQIRLTNASRPPALPPLPPLPDPRPATLVAESQPQAAGHDDDDGWEASERGDDDHEHDGEHGEDD